MSKHTPGPWTVLPGDDFDGGLTVYCDDVERLPTISMCSLTISVGEGVEEGDKHWPVVEANARLIAAAPEMLEALKDAVEVFEIEVPQGNRTIERMHAAIAKAEGRS